MCLHTLCVPLQNCCIFCTYCWQYLAHNMHVFNLLFNGNLYTGGVNIKFPYCAVYRPYRTLKKRLARPYRFILLVVTQYYCYTRSEYKAVSSGFFFSVYTVAILPACFLLGSSASVHRLFLLFSSINSFSSLRRLFMLFYSPVPLRSVNCFCSSRRLIASLLASFALVRRLFLLF